MSKWTVRGAWKSDGHEAEMSVEAASQVDAEKVASSRGLLVESCLVEGLAIPPAVLTCPKCQSTNVATAAVVYEQGATTGTVAGGSYQHKAGAGVFAGGTKSQTLLAARCAPPKKESANVFAAAVLIGLFSFCLSKVFAICILLVAAILFIQLAANGATLPRRLATWRKTWVCLQCGEMFKRN